MRITFKKFSRIAERNETARKLFPFTLSKWYGRLGNNIQQVCLGILYAQKNSCAFYSPEHVFFDELDYDCGFRKRFFPSMRNRFFFYLPCPAEGVVHADFEIDYAYIRENLHEVARKYVYPKLRMADRAPLAEGTLVIHIRGGDVFVKDARVSPDYVQNPLSYFEQLIEQYDRTLLVVEPGVPNPVVAILAARKDVSVQSGSVEQDFATLMSARNLASSGVGTFCVAAALCSPNLRNFHCSDRYSRGHLNPEFLDPNRVEVHCTRLDGYIEIGQWNSNPRTIDRMLTHRL